MNGIIAAGFLPRFFQAVHVFSLIAELEWIKWNLRKYDALIFCIVEHRLQAQVWCKAVMVVRAGKHELIGLKVTVKHHLAGVGILDPHVLRHIALDAEDGTDFGADEILDPVQSL